MQQVTVSKRDFNGYSPEPGNYFVRPGYLCVVVEVISADTVIAAMSPLKKRKRRAYMENKGNMAVSRVLHKERL